MTRKQALDKAIEVLSQSEEYGEEVKTLKALKDTLPLIRWDDATIRDSIEQFIYENGRVPVSSDFKKKGMPVHSMFKCIYGITHAEWMNENYPNHKMTHEEKKELFTKDFIEDYYNIKPRSQEAFNRNKRENTRGWQTIAQYHNVTSWRNLLKKLDLPLYFDMYRDHKPTQFQINVYIDEDYLTE